MSTQFDMTTREGIPVLSVVGQLSQGELRPFDERLDKLAERAQGPRVVDLLSCPFITSLIVPCLLRANEVAADAGGNLWIVAGKQLQMVLKVLRLETRLRLRDDLDTCIAEAKAGAPEPTEPVQPDDFGANELEARKADEAPAPNPGEDL